MTDYQTARLSLKGHPMQFLRPFFKAEGVMSCVEVCGARNGRIVRTAGVVLVRQRSGKGNAVFVMLVPGEVMQAGDRSNQSTVSLAGHPRSMRIVPPSRDFH